MRVFLLSLQIMRIVLQRVSHASVTINGSVKSEIDKGYLVLLGIEEADTTEDIDWLVKKIIGLRVFDDEHGVMNVDIKAVGGSILVVSQFTLMASYKKGNRPPRHRHPTLRDFLPAIGRSLGKTCRDGRIWR